MTLQLSPRNNPAAIAFAQLLYSILDGVTLVHTGPTPYPLHDDFTSGGTFQIDVNGVTGVAKITFELQGFVLTGGLDLAKLEAALVTAPHFIDAENSTTLGPGASIRFDSPPVTRQKGGVFFITGEWDGTQDAQALVTGSMYRDYGTPGQVHLNDLHIAPGGVGAFNFSLHRHDFDTLPDDQPHTYTIIATSGGASNLTAPPGGAAFYIFELGGPG